VCVCVCVCVCDKQREKELNSAFGCVLEKRLCARAREREREGETESEREREMDRFSLFLSKHESMTFEKKLFCSLSR